MAQRKRKFSNRTTLRITRQFMKSFMLLMLASMVGFTLVQLDITHNLLTDLMSVRLVAELLAGALYTSFVTIPISLSLLSVLAEGNNVFLVAVLAGVGALATDLVMHKLFANASNGITVEKPARSPRKNPIYRSALATLGFICLALPLPDEVAMSILGTTKIKSRTLLWLIYPIKTTGILLVLLSFQAIQ